MDKASNTVMTPLGITTETQYNMSGMEVERVKSPGVSISEQYDKWKRKICHQLLWVQEEKQN